MNNINTTDTILKKTEKSNTGFLIILILLILLSLLFIIYYIYYLKPKETPSVSPPSVSPPSVSPPSVSPPPVSPPSVSEMDKYKKIYNDAHKYAYSKFLNIIGSTFDPETNSGKMTKAICKNYYDYYKNATQIDPDNKLNYYEWHDEAIPGGACITYPKEITKTCDMIQEQFKDTFGGEINKGYFKYIPPEFTCDVETGICNIKSKPFCDIPPEYCTKQTSKPVKIKIGNRCINQCEIQPLISTCGYAFGDLFCRSIAYKLRPLGINSQDIPKELTLNINVNNTSSGWLRPTNLWDPEECAGKLTINYKGEIASSDNILRLSNQDDPLGALLKHDSQYKAFMGLLGHYYVGKSFDWLRYVNFLIQQNYKPVSTDNDLHIYTIDFVNFDDWISNPDTCNPYNTIKRMLIMCMATNFRMRPLNLSAVNNEIWADKTKTFNVPYSLIKDPDSVPYVPTDLSISGEQVLYKNYSRLMKWESRNNNITDVILMKWPSGYKLKNNNIYRVFENNTNISTDIDLEQLLRDNLQNLKSELFEVGEFISAVKNPPEGWPKWTQYDEIKKVNSKGSLNRYTPKMPGLNNVIIPPFGTYITSNLLIENNSLIVRVKVDLYQQQEI